MNAPCISRRTAIISLVITALSPFLRCGENNQPYKREKIGDAGQLPDYKTTQIPDISRQPEIDPISSLELRTKIIISQDTRFKLYDYKTKQPYLNINLFIQDLVKEYGVEGTQKTVASLEKTALELNGIEARLKNTYNSSLFFQEINFEVSNIPLGGGGHANAKALSITLFPPITNENNKYMRTVITHEYGHFLYFHDINGNVVIPPNTPGYPIDMAEMAQNRVVNRYHLRKIYFLPYLSQNLTSAEHGIFVELIAHKVALTLLGQKELSDFINIMLGVFYSAIENSTQAYDQKQLLFAAGLAKISGLNNHESFFIKKLIESGMSQIDINSSLKQILFCFDSIQIVNQ